MAEGQFDKDFGYLTPFLDKVATAAASLTDAAARAELTKLMAEEKTRWARIRQLLAGASGQSSPVASANAAQAPSSDAPVPPEHEPLSFTVGSLRPRSR